jgi:hypothetical protein
VGRGEAKAQVEFSACGKWNDVPCASTKSWGWEKNGATNRNFCDIIPSSKKGKERKPVARQRVFAFSFPNLRRNDL